MTYVTKSEINERWDSLPEVLRKTMVAETTSDFVWKTCEAEHLSKQKIYDVARVVGYVFLGFIHPGDLADELVGVLQSDKRTAAAIASPITVRLLDPLKTELDGVYEPSSKFEEDGGPKIIQDIGPSPKVSIGFSGSVPPPPPTPAPGWSRETPSQPVVRLSGAIPTTPPASAAQPKIPPPAAPKPAVPTPPSPPSAKPAAPPPGTMDEFERLAQQRAAKNVPTAPSTTPTPPKPAVPAAPAPAPVMLHSDTEFKAQPQAPGFHLELPKKPIDMNAGPSAPKPPKLAVLELGTTPPPAPKQGPSTTRVVHYSEYKSPSPERPVQPQAPSPAQGDRHVTEITAGTPPTAPTAPMPPKPPAPAPAPRPAAPPAATPSPDNVIYKDYTSADAVPKVPPAPPKP